MQIVKSGVWRYDGSVDESVDIVALDFDFWHEIAKADGTLEEGEEPQHLSVEGQLYYVRFVHAGELAEPTWVDSVGHQSIADALVCAEGRVPEPIRWM